MAQKMAEIGILERRVAIQRTSALIRSMKMNMKNRHCADANTPGFPFVTYKADVSCTAHLDYWTLSCSTSKDRVYANGGLGEDPWIPAEDDNWNCRVSIRGTVSGD